MNNEIIETNENGGKNSKIAARYDLIPPEILKLLAGVFYEGALKYAPNNWKLVRGLDHLNHALNHLVEYRLSDGISYEHPDMNKDKEHLGHFLCRVVMYVYMELINANIQL